MGIDGVHRHNPAGSRPLTHKSLVRLAVCCDTQSLQPSYHGHELEVTNMLRFA